MSVSALDCFSSFFELLFSLSLSYFFCDEKMIFIIIMAFGIEICCVPW